MEDDFQIALSTLRSGGIILYPTDTIWGIGCRADDSEAVRRIFRIKQRADSKSMLVLVGDTDQLRSIAGDKADAGAELTYGSDRPLTVIYSGARGLAPELLAADGSAGVRLCGYSFAARLCRELGKPIVSTSANISRQPSPSVYSEIPEDIIHSVDYVCTTGRDLPKAKASRIIKIDDTGRTCVIRD